MDDRNTAYKLLLVLSVAMSAAFLLLYGRADPSIEGAAQIFGAAAFSWVVSSFFVKFWSARAGYIAFLIIQLGMIGDTFGKF